MGTRHWTTGVAAAGLVTALAVVAIGSGGTARATAHVPALTLEQAMSQPHGVAAGDPIHDSIKDSHKSQNPDAKGVDEGNKKQATGTKTRKDAPPVTAEQLYQKGDFSAGCTIGYGHGKACLPVTPPSAGAMGMTVKQMPWTCTEVRTLLPAGILLDVKGVDPAHLDTNGDGTACGQGD